MTLGRPADRGIAGHVRDRVHCERADRDVAPDASGGPGSLDACVAGADDDDVVVLHLVRY